MENLKIFLLPSGLIMLLFQIIWAVKYPTEIMTVLLFRDVETKKDAVVSCGFWLWEICASATLVYLVKHFL